MIYAFGRHELDSDLYALRRDGQPVKLAPKAFDVLLLLVRHRDRVVSKAELLDEVWPGEHVTESVLPANVNAIRRALGDERAAARCVQTVHGRGYRFVAEVEEHGAGSPPDPPATDETFVGREPVMAELAGRLDAALAGRGSLVLLAGEPGIGKTRTARELAGLARERGTWVLTGEAYEGEGAPAFWPWIQVLREAAEALDDEELRAVLGTGAADVAHLVPGIRARFPELDVARALDSDEARFRLFDSVAACLRGLARRRPVLLVLDDLHWSDEPSLLLLRFLSPQLEDHAILVLGAYRDVELRRTHPLAKTLGALARDPAFHRLTLRGLEAEDVACFVAAVGGAPAPPELVASVCSLTEGNPFFVQEVVQLLAAEGRLGGPVDAFSLPQGVREVIGRRLDALDERTNDLLRLASVLGSEFGVSALESLSGVPRATLLDTLERGLRARILRSEGLPLGRYAFSHVLIRETLYEEIPAPERITLHGRAGEVLEAVYGPQADEHVAELAHHFYEAAPGGGVERAVEYTLRGADRAFRLLAFEEAVALRQRALQVLQLRVPVDEARRCELRVGLGEAQLAAGLRGEAMASLRGAADVARQLDRGDLLARVATAWPPTMGRQMVAWNAEYRPLVEEALSAVGEEEMAVRATLISALAVTPPDTDSMERRDGLSSEAVALARRSRDDASLVRALESRLWALSGPDRQAERLEVATERVGVAERTGSEVLVFNAREHRVRSLIALARLAEADAEIAECDRLAEALRLPNYRLSVLRFRMERALGDGRLGDAQALLDQCQAWVQRIDEPDAAVMRSLWVVWLEVTRGGLDELAPYFDGFVGEAEQWVGPPARTFIAYYYALLERLDDARRHFDAVAGRGFADLARDEDWLLTLAVAAETCADLGDRDVAASLYGLLEPFGDANVSHLHMRHYVGSGHHFLARLAAELGRDAQAERHFEQALAANAVLGARPFLARTRYEYGRWLKARGSAAQRATELLECAERDAAETGMQELLAKARRAAVC